MNNNFVYLMELCECSHGKELKYVCCCYTKKDTALKQLVIEADSQSDIRAKQDKKLGLHFFRKQNGVPNELESGFWKAVYYDDGETELSVTIVRLEVIYE